MTMTLQSLSTQAQTLTLPDRHPDALPASQLIEAWAPLDREDREARIWAEISSGNIPEFLRDLSEIRDTLLIRCKKHHIRYYCTPDYLAVGSDSDYLLVPMSAKLAQRLADGAGACLPTAKMVDHIYTSAAIKLRPQPIPPSPEMTTLPVFIRHQEMIRQQLDSLGIGSRQMLIAGHKKDIIISNRIRRGLKTNVPRPVVIYGWHRLNGKPIQPVYNGHGETYADYSHGVRLVYETVWLDGKRHSLRRLLKSLKWHGLFSNEGRLKRASYGSSPRK